VTCPYHGWSYRHDGALMGLPVRESFPGLDRGQQMLRPVKVDTAFGFVFVALTGNPRPVRDIWGVLGEELTPYRFEDMEPLVPVYLEHWNVDWKIVMDNYLESYHVPIGHPGLNRMFTPDYEDQLGVPGVARGASWFREKYSSRWSERMYQTMIGGITGHLPEPNRWISSRSCPMVRANRSFAVRCLASPTSAAKCALRGT
jgi:phenylpropionate dioxygenase-like ring-hydroxylating dioxygenase large terminal subunit